MSSSQALRLPLGAEQIRRGTLLPALAAARSLGRKAARIAPPAGKLLFESSTTGAAAGLLQAQCCSAFPEPAA